jgi:hemerythrin-like metal-binding domain
MLWKDIYELGVPSIDAQHKELFQQVDNLLYSSSMHKTKETLDFLGNYVVEHFGHEEVLQAESGYPKKEEHKKMHDDFIATYIALRTEFDSHTGENELDTSKLSQVIMDWLKTHVLVADREFAEYYKYYLQQQSRLNAC